MKPRAVMLVGPTASGKTSLAVALSKQFPIEVVNADGLQVFRKLDIGTAKPSPRILSLLPHHLIDVLDPDAEISASWYAGQARRAIERVWSRGRIPLIVGGAGFYLRALERPPTALPSPPHQEVENLAEAYEKIRREDPAAAEKIHPNDRYRISRAYSLLVRGIKPTDEWRNASEQASSHETLWIGLAWDREALYDRINRRVVDMFEQGLAHETESVLKDFPKAERRLARTIGYREVLHVLRSAMSQDDARTAAQQATRQYAKRQLTWFRKEPRIQWFSPDRAFDGAARLMAEV